MFWFLKNEEGASTQTTKVQNLDNYVLLCSGLGSLVFDMINLQSNNFVRYFPKYLGNDNVTMNNAQQMHR